MNNALFDHLCGFAQDQYVKHGAFHPMLIGYDELGGPTPIMFELPDPAEVPRERVAAGLAELLRRNDCRSYGLVHEAWMKSLRGGRDDGLTPSKSPDRIEILQVCAVYPDRRRRWRLYEIDRGKVIGLVQDIGGDSSSVPGLSMTGWLFELLP